MKANANLMKNCRDLVRISSRARLRAKPLSSLKSSRTPDDFGGGPKTEDFSLKSAFAAFAGSAHITRINEWKPPPPPKPVRPLVENLAPADAISFDGNWDDFQFSE
jgi:hypothetical protein